MKTQTDIATAHASKYLQQLCKHWAHRMAVEFTPSEGLVPFSPDARCTLKADAQALRVAIEAPDEATCARLGQVVFDHLRRFAFREEFGGTGLARGITRRNGTRLCGSRSRTKAGVSPRKV